MVIRLLQFLTSAQDDAGNYLAPGAVVLATGTAWLAFVVMAVIVLWRRAKAAAVTFALTELALFSFAVLQLAVPFSSGSTIVLLWNATKIVELIAFVWVLLKLFRSGVPQSTDARTSQ